MHHQAAVPALVVHPADQVHPRGRRRGRCRLLSPAQERQGHDQGLQAKRLSRGHQRAGGAEEMDRTTGRVYPWFIAHRYAENCHCWLPIRASECGIQTDKHLPQMLRYFLLLGTAWNPIRRHSCVTDTLVSDGKARWRPFIASMSSFNSTWRLTPQPAKAIRTSRSRRS